MAVHNTERFSNRADDYVKYRPHYPDAIIPYLEGKYLLTNHAKVADVGAGTGISAELFLNAGYTVTAVEPNEAMRQKSVEILGTNPRFTAIDGTAEHTLLEDNSIDVIVAAQAFHWFDATKTKVAFQRILKPDGIAVLIWNERNVVTPFETAYEQLIQKHGRDYVQVKHRNIEASDIASFFSPSAMDCQVFAQHQHFNFEGLSGRLSSSSYMPAKQENGYDEMMVDLKQLFDHYQLEDTIRIHYTTTVYSGIL